MLTLQYGLLPRVPYIYIPRYVYGSTPTMVIGGKTKTETLARLYLLYFSLSLSHLGKHPRVTPEQGHRRAQSLHALRGHNLTPIPFRRTAVRDGKPDVSQKVLRLRLVQPHSLCNSGVCIGET